MYRFFGFLAVLLCCLFITVGCGGGGSNGGRNNYRNNSGNPDKISRPTPTPSPAAGGTATATGGAGGSSSSNSSSSSTAVVFIINLPAGSPYANAKIQRETPLGNGLFGNKRFGNNLGLLIKASVINIGSYNDHPFKLFVNILRPDNQGETGWIELKPVPTLGIPHGIDPDEDSDNNGVHGAIIPVDQWSGKTIGLMYKAEDPQGNIIAVAPEKADNPNVAEFQIVNIGTSHEQ